MCIYSNFSFNFNQCYQLAIYSGFMDDRDTDEEYLADTSSSSTSISGITKWNEIWLFR